MLNNDILRKKAEKSIEIIMSEKDDNIKIAKMEFLITGVGAFQLINDENVAMEHHYEMVVDAANDYFKNHPDSNINKIFEKGLSESAKDCASYYTFSNTCNTLIYQLDLEKRNEASIDIDDHEALDNLKQMVVELKELKNEDVINYMNKVDAYLQEQHGKSIK